MASPHSGVTNVYTWCLSCKDCLLCLQRIRRLLIWRHSWFRLKELFVYSINQYWYIFCCFILLLFKMELRLPLYKRNSIFGWQKNVWILIQLGLPLNKLELIRKLHRIFKNKYQLHPWEGCITFSFF